MRCGLNGKGGADAFDAGDGQGLGVPRGDALRPAVAMCG
ncbi:hypothetical protein FH063_002211 [Azospirillum argentinense]|uniref:Uncharacterized protein n=1 Tax=Azospirillum argentinense TaxID=2970906 RepID=A0A5B0KQ04_9PROT|nr:hypothetical protein FH063_002211 [Azospirillum argentinense]